MTWFVIRFMFILFTHIRHPQSRNFALNPGQGLKIRPFKNAHTSEALADRELDKLSRYLVHIAGVDDFQCLTHRVRMMISVGWLIRVRLIFDHD
jgi:hypothetical protein